jgi:hypothetical protein
MVKGPPLLRTTAAVTAFDEVGPGMIPPLAILFSAPRRRYHNFPDGITASPESPINASAAQQNSTRICRAIDARRERGRDHLSRWTKIEAASMAVVVADQIVTRSRLTNRGNFASPFAVNIRG